MPGEDDSSASPDGAATAIGAWCMAANLATPWVSMADAPRWWTAFVASTLNPAGIYWLVVFGVWGRRRFPRCCGRGADCGRRSALNGSGCLRAGCSRASPRSRSRSSSKKSCRPTRRSHMRPVSNRGSAPSSSAHWRSCRSSRLLGAVRPGRRRAGRAARRPPVRARARYTSSDGDAGAVCRAQPVFLSTIAQESLAAIADRRGPCPLLLAAIVIVLGLAALRLRAPMAGGARPPLLSRVVRRPNRRCASSSSRIARQSRRMQSPRASAAKSSSRLHAEAEVFLADEPRTRMRHVGDKLPSVALAAKLTDLALGDPRRWTSTLHDATSPLRRLPAVERRWLESGDSP